MKKIIFLILSVGIMLLIPGMGVFAKADNSDIPAEVLAYAQGAGMASMKSFMKDPNKGYIGNGVSSAEEIEALALGQGYALSYFDLNDYSSLSACAKPAGEWLFSLDNKDGELCYFTVIAEEEGGFSTYGAVDAKNLSSALGVIRRLSEGEGVAFAPVIHQTMSGFVVAQSFGGGDKVITVPGGAFSLDGSYLEVTSSEELPTFEEYTSAVLSSLIPYIDPETGEPIDLASLPIGSGEIELLPHPAAAAAPVAAEPGSKAAGKTWLVPVIACSAAALIVAAAVILGLRGRKARKDG